MQKCDYGCGNDALKFSKRTRKWCCSNNPRQCSAYRQQIAERTQTQMATQYGPEEGRLERKKNYHKLQPVTPDNPGTCSWCGAAATHYRLSDRKFCCARTARQCPVYLASQSATAAAHAESIMDSGTRAKIQKKKRSIRSSARRTRLSAELPPDGQLCENQCGRPAKYHLMRVVPTETGGVLRWYWCCSDHYKKCPALLQRSEERRTETSLERYGVKHHMQDPRFIAMREQTSLERYGVTHAMKLAKFVAKKQAAEIEHCGSLRHSFDLRMSRLREQYPGLENFAQLPEVKEVIGRTMVERYGGYYSKNQTWIDAYRNKTGVEHPSRLQSTRDNYRMTCQERYGTDSTSQVPEFKEKTRKTHMLRYGVPHPFQSSAFFNSVLRGSKYRRFPYTFPSGVVIQVQGYEDLVIDNLLQQYPESDLKFGVDCPAIWYELNGKQHRYHPDIFVQSRSLIVEVKSDYTFTKSFEINWLKARASRSAGFAFEFHIMSSRKSPTRIINVQ